MEEYKGVKFTAVLSEGNFDCSEMLEIDKHLTRFIKTMGNEGNFSIRKEIGFLIKRAGAKMTELTEGDIVYVKRVDENTVYAIGKTPSSESLMHHAIYSARKDVNVIFHFHDNELLKRKIDLEVGPFDYGSPELAKSVSDALLKGDFVKVREHGFVLVGKDIADLFKKMERFLKK
jgi:L-fuculose-phosphate aldolase